MDSTTATGIMTLLLALSTKSTTLPADMTEDLLPRELGITCRGNFFCSGNNAVDNILPNALSETGGCSASPGQQTLLRWKYLRIYSGLRRIL
ncbi:MAG: hypothetical protein ALECFALPRED_000498 [Alectoria fallacina]|uniref:Secreted protein n=1 Tax=Alectoria fallacina TaxID=1903189 RepID=A0A8H3F6S4_9LECA|nr:MAG: hypothetical protein ALECFALPRED_000498 [Alectoria fallacina]